MSAKTIPVNADDYDTADKLANQLLALLQHAFGASGESFRSLSDEHQDNYIWACADLVELLCTTLSSGIKGDA